MIHTPLGIDQLENRMLCAVDLISELLQSLNGLQASPGSPSLQSAANRAPTTSSIRVTNTQPISRTVNLSVTGGDDKGESLLTYRWSVTSTTSGATGSFSLNGTNSAKNTTLSFSRAAVYDVRVTATDRGGLTASSTLRITVSQILSSIQVTPGSTSLAGGRTQQMTARALDQFQQPLTRQPAFAWSASGGTINASGLFTAANSASTVTVTARSGGFAGTARLTVTASTPTPTPAPSLLQNAGISSLVNTYFADGSINRNEMIQLLRSAGNNGNVDSSELSDFRYIVSNATRYNIPGYVQVLANNVVNTNVANARIQGQTAGNLTVGSSSTLLNKLIDKWFLGTDLPTLTGTSLSYRTASGSLFNGTPSIANMKQGQLGDCYFIASLGSIATRNPSAITNMFVDNGDGTFTVRFYTGVYGSYYNADGSISDGFRSGISPVADYITVNRQLPTLSNGALAYSGYGWSATNTANSLWIALAEKAYAQWNETGKSGRNGTNTYASIEGGWMGVVNSQVLGYNSTSYSFNAQGQTALINALGTGRAVTLGTRSGVTAGGLVGGHAYVVSSYDSSAQTFTLTNPWGFSHPTPLTWAQLQANCSMFVVANPSTTSPIVSNGATPSVRGESTNGSMLAVMTPIAITASNEIDSAELTTESLFKTDGRPASEGYASIEQWFQSEELNYDQLAYSVADQGSYCDEVDQALASLVDLIHDGETLDTNVA